MDAEQYAIYHAYMVQYISYWIAWSAITFIWLIILHAIDDDWTSRRKRKKHRDRERREP